MRMTGFLLWLAAAVLAAYGITHDQPLICEGCRSIPDQVLESAARLHLDMIIAAATFFVSGTILFALGQLAVALELGEGNGGMRLAGTALMAAGILTLFYGFSWEPPISSLHNIIPEDVIEASARWNIKVVLLGVVLFVSGVTMIGLGQVVSLLSRRYAVADIPAAPAQD